MYLILLHYVSPAEVVDEHRPAHRAYLDTLYAAGKLVFSGPRDPLVGGVILACTDDEEEVQRMIEGDPFNRHGVAVFEPVRFQPVKHAPAFAPFVVAAS